MTRRNWTSTMELVAWVLPMALLVALGLTCLGGLIFGAYWLGGRS